MAYQYVLLLKPRCPVVLSETLSCFGSDTLSLRVLG